MAMPKPLGHKGTKPKIDARLVTRDGLLGLYQEDPQYLASTLKYDEVGINCQERG